MLPSRVRLDVGANGRLKGNSTFPTTLKVLNRSLATGYSLTSYPGLCFIYHNPQNECLRRQDDCNMPPSPTLFIHYRSEKVMAVVRVWHTNIFGSCPTFGHFPPLSKKKCYQPPLLKRMKTFLRNTMSENRLDALALN